MPSDTLDNAYTASPPQLKILDTTVHVEPCSHVATCAVHLRGQNDALNTCKKG